LYKDLEPFFYLDPSDERDERFPLPKKYFVSRINTDDHYEGEVAGCGNSYGKGIVILDIQGETGIEEGFFNPKLELDGFGRRIILKKVN